MNLYQITKQRDGQDPKPNGSILASNFEEAKRAFTMQIYDDLATGRFGDNYCYYDDDIIEDDAPSWYEEPGVYDVSYTPPELVLADSDLKDGIPFFREDVYMFKIWDEEAV